jgi:tRNA-dihydrouridine synthase B
LILQNIFMKTLIPGYSVGSVRIEPGLVLSPMSGVTTMAFRRLIRELNPGAVGLLVSEFISVEGLTRESRRSMEMMRHHPSEKPYCIQIFGYDINRMRDAALMAQDAGADIVDINCGCPAPKVVRKGGGCELMRQPHHLAAMLKEVRSHLSVPLTIKIRSGWCQDTRNAVEIARMAEGEGVAALAIHGRTRTELYRGEADWDIVAEVVRAVSIPVSGSGDVVCQQSALKRLEAGVQGLYIGRAAIADPLVFSRILGSLDTTHETREDPELLFRIMYLYITFLLEEFSPKTCVGKLKQLVSQMAKGNSWAKDLCRAKSLEEQLLIVENNFGRDRCRALRDEWNVRDAA